MKSVVFLYCLAAACSATFLLSNKSPDAYNICVYSQNPGRFAPKCFACLKIVYPNALLACVNATAMPTNISYDAAGCLDMNCKINYPTAPAASIESKWSFLEQMSRFLTNARSARSVDNNAVDNEDSESSENVTRIMNPSDLKIISEVEVYASDMEYDEDDTDYAD